MSEWTIEENEYLGNLIELKQLKVEEMAYLLNSRFNTTRTVSSLNKLLEDYDKKGWKTEQTPNSRKSWVTADDKYLLENWTADDDIRQEVAEHLGRSVASCSTRTSVLKNRPELKEYYLTLITGGLQTNLPTTISEDIDEPTTNVSYLLVATPADQYTLSDKIYHWWKSRATVRAVKRDMRRMDKENIRWKKKEDLDRKRNLQQQINMLENKIKEIGA